MGRASERTVILDWRRPLLGEVVDRLGELAVRDGGGGTLDLSAGLVVVPTRNAGRRLREALALAAATRSDAAVVVPPAVATPESLVAGAAQRDQAAPMASPTAVIAAWGRVFAEVDSCLLEPVFREGIPAAGDVRATHGAIRLIEQARATLAEGGLGFREVARRFGSRDEGSGAGVPAGEAERWSALGRLEAALLARLHAAGLADPQRARIEASAAGRLPGEADWVVMAATPDPMPLAVQLLERWEAGGGRLEVWIHADPSERGAFDSWGRPLEEAWRGRPLGAGAKALPFTRPLAEAEWIAGRVDRYDDPARHCVIGAVDREAAPHLERALGLLGRRIFDPEGVPFRESELAPVLDGIGDLVAERSIDVVARLLRIPSLGRWALRAVPESGRPGLTVFLKAFDAFRVDHLPASLEAAIGLAPRFRGRLAQRVPGEVLRAVFRRFDDLAGRAGRTGDRLSDWLLPLLAEVFEGRRVSGEVDGDAAFLEAARSLQSAVAEVDDACAAVAARIDGAGRLALLAAALRGTRLPGHREPGAVEILGWLELHWEDAPHVCVLGANDGILPDAVVGDCLVPESLRRALGVKTNEQRHARDAYLLAALEACRADGGRLDVTFAKASDRGDPLKPSRLLMQAPLMDLPERIRRLFGDPLDAGAGDVPAFQRAWRLEVGRVIGGGGDPAGEDDRVGDDRESALPALPVTAFRDYLRCPFRFFLKRELGMRSVEARPFEISAADFGTLVHDTLEAMGCHPEVSVSENADEIRAFLVDDFRRRFAGRFGRDLPLPVALQRHSGEQRLAAFAARQAELVRGGWRIERTEFDLGEVFPLEVGGIQVTGRVDRLDHHPDHGWRIIDYKTGRKRIAPAEQHLGGRSPEPRPAWQFVEVPKRGRRRGGRKRWLDLQLPLYLEAVRRARGPRVEAAFFSLPIAVGDTGLDVFDALGDEETGEAGGEVLDAAVRCAARIVENVAAGAFWPPSEGIESRLDDFASLFHEGVAASVTPAPGWTDWREDGAAAGTAGATKGEVMP